MVKYVKGSQLKPEAKREALARFVHRFTMESVPQWSRRAFSQPIVGPPLYYSPQYRSDAEWLERTVFAITDKRGDLSKGGQFCYSRDHTWPLGKFLGELYT